MKIGPTLSVTLMTLLAFSGGALLAQDPRGADLARRLGCFACHQGHDQGGNGALSLNGVGARLAPQELRLAIAFPRRLHPGAKMPSYAYLPPAEQEALVDFLGTLK